MKNQGEPKILIVEDDDDLRRLYETKLKDANFNVTVCNDGQAGYDKIIEIKPTVVLLDLILPRMNGFDILEKLKEEKVLDDNISIIVLSALGQDDDIYLAKDLGAKDYLIKSNIRLSDIVDKVNQYI